jgi:hypothetical protein
MYFLSLTSKCAGYQPLRPPEMHFQPLVSSISLCPLLTAISPKHFIHPQKNGQPD